MKNMGATKSKVSSTLFVRNTVKAFIAVASFVAVGVASPDANADRIKGSYSTGQHLDGGGCFSQSFSRGIGTGYVSANVQLSGWDLNYKSSDHHIDRVKVRISGVSYNSSTGNVSFTVSGCYDDKNDDDDYYWEVWYTILAQT
jgi:hypothetical protein